MEWILLAISAFATISGALNVWTARVKNNKKDAVNGAVKGAVADATLLQDMKYIREKIDEIHDNIEMYGFKIEKLQERMTRIEERVKHNETRIKELGVKS